jgi:hypothetical protein
MRAHSQHSKDASWPNCIFWANLKPFSLEFIATFPNGLHTFVGEKGVKLSGGQKPGLLTQGGQGGRPAPLASRLHRIPTRFLSNLHGI